MREKLIEIMARGMCIADEHDPDDGSYVLHAFHKDRPAWKNYESAADAALAALEAAGVRLVPVEATEEMLEYALGSINYTMPDPSGDAERVYSAMLAASPYRKDTE